MCTELTDDRGPLSLITKFCTFEWMYSNQFELLIRFFTCLAMFPFWNFRTWNAPQGQFDPSTWSSMASTGPQHPSMDGFVSGFDPYFNASQQQQAQSQAQIEFLR